MTEEEKKLEKIQKYKKERDALWAKNSLIIAAAKVQPELKEKAIEILVDAYQHDEIGWWDSQLNFKRTSS